MNEQNTQPPVQLTPEQNLQNVEQVRDLFARAHDYIAQANHPGHLGSKVGEVLNFLAFQYNDFKMRCETLKKQIKSEVDVVAAKAEVDKALAVETTATEAVSEAPKA